MSASQPAGRTQAERSRETREKIIQGTLRCLQQHGYAGTTVSRVLAESGVSRGAYLHHYPSKADLFRDAAEQLMRAAYRRLGKATQSTSGERETLARMFRAAWQDVFKQPEADIFIELAVASRSDDTLARIFHPLAMAYVTTLRQSAGHYFEGQGTQDPADLVMLTQWLFRGMAMDLPLADQPDYFDRFISLWIEMMSSQLKLRNELPEKPPRPAWPGDQGQS
ncbi:MAG: TetR/AcrR family transcriptional regulator [Pseudomonadota bacterium]